MVWDISEGENAEMFKLPKSVQAHWNDVKGNAKWDLIKWCCLSAARFIAAQKGQSMPSPLARLGTRRARHSRQRH